MHIGGARFSALSPRTEATAMGATIPLITEAELEARTLSPRARAMRRMMLNRLSFGLSMATRMPLLALSGARVLRLSLTQAQVVLPHGWRSQNIFGSTYFAAQLMAAEAACGGLVLLHHEEQGGGFGPIVKRVEVDYLRAGFEPITFTCDEGVRAARLLERARRDSGQRVEETLTVIGTTPREGEVTRVQITWSARHKAP